MSSKALRVNLNRQERQLINEVCVLTNKLDRSKVIKELAIEAATVILEHDAARRMKLRQQRLEEQSAGDTSGNTEQAQASADTDSTGQAEAAVVADTGAGEQSPGQAEKRVGISE
jgi:hypothetical protein